MAPDTPPLADLLARFLARQAEARMAGIPEAPVNEVEPYEVAAFPMVEPRAAWDEAVHALRLLDSEKAVIRVTPPVDWAGLVTAPVSLAALPFAGGNFPQLVRDLPELIRTTRRADLQPKAESALPASGLDGWATQAIRKRQFPEALLAIGTLRLARQTEKAAELLTELRPHVPARWQPAFANEEAALAWQRGDAEKAREAWNSLPESAPVLFNRGMAALFSDRPTEAREALTRAIAQLPEDNPWHQLGRLYLALAQM
jgi:tetratricopeptide (TPR) repeat protein